jgi:hypothetical protein
MERPPFFGGYKAKQLHRDNFLVKRPGLADKEVSE